MLVTLQSQNTISLETPVGSEEDSELGDFVEDQKTTSPYEATNRAILREESPARATNDNTNLRFFIVFNLKNKY